MRRKELNWSLSIYERKCGDLYKQEQQPACKRRLDLPFRHRQSCHHPAAPLDVTLIERYAYHNMVRRYACQEVDLTVDKNQPVFLSQD